MTYRSLVFLASTALLAALLLLSGAAQAQASRTWVSGVGDDANPCSRTAPCKTFAGAISKTAAKGEISVLDPGGYGAVTITKSITISGTGTLAGILSAGTTGVIVNAGAADVVVLRDISIEGFGTGLNGIRFLAGGALHVERVSISGTVGRGIDFQPSGNSELFVRDSTIQRNGNSGIAIEPGLAGTALVTLDGVQVVQNQAGIRIKDRSNIMASRSVISGNVGSGVAMVANTNAAQMALDHCTVSSNGSDGNNAGIRSEGSQATVRISNNTITDNSVGLLIANNGEIISFGSNQVGGNGTDGSPTSTVTTR